MKRNVRQKIKQIKKHTSSILLALVVGFFIFTLVSSPATRIWASQLIYTYTTATTATTSGTSTIVSTTTSTSTRTTATSTTTPSSTGYDSWLDQSNPNTNYGTSDRLHIDGYSGNAQRAILSFTNPLPSNAVVDSAWLVLYAVGAWDGNPNGRTYWCYRATRLTWTEAGVTWNKYDGSNSWSTAGGDYTTSNGEAAMYDGWLPEISWYPTAQIQYAVTNSLNFHFIIKDGSENAESSIGFQFDSCESSTTEHRPILGILYHYPNTTTTLTLTTTTSSTITTTITTPTTITTDTWRTELHDYGTPYASSYAVSSNYTLAEIYTDSDHALKVSFYDRSTTSLTLVDTITIATKLNWYYDGGLTLAAISNIQKEAATNKDHFAVAWYSYNAENLYIKQFNITFSGTSPDSYEAGDTATYGFLHHTGWLRPLSAYLSTSGDAWVSHSEYDGVSANYVVDDYAPANLIGYSNNGGSADPVVIGATSDSGNTYYHKFMETYSDFFAIKCISPQANVSSPTPFATLVYSVTDPPDDTDWADISTLKFTDSQTSTTPVSLWANSDFDTAIMISQANISGTNFIWFRAATIHPSAMWSSQQIPLPTGLTSALDLTMSSTKGGLEYITIHGDDNIGYYLQSSNEFQSYITFTNVDSSDVKLCATQYVFPSSTKAVSTLSGSFIICTINSGNARDRTWIYPYESVIKFTGAITATASTNLIITTILAGTYTATNLFSSSTALGTVVVYETTAMPAMTTYMLAGLFTLAPVCLLLFKERSILSMLTGLTTGLTIAVAMGLLPIWMLLIVVAMAVAAIFFNLRNRGE